MAYLLATIHTPSWALPWWSAMVILNIISFLIGIFILFKSKRADNKEPKTAEYRSKMRVAGLIFITVALYRSIFVSSYPERISWFESMANSPIIIRSLAFFAELAFAALIMWSLLNMNKDVPLPQKHKNNKILNFLETKTPYVFFVFIFLAQFFAIGGLFTQYTILFALEETFWALSFLLIAPLLVIKFKQVFSNKDKKYKKEMTLYRSYLIIMVVFTFGYLIFQFAFALPVTLCSQIAADMAKPHPTLMQGIYYSIYNFTATRDFETWGGWGFFIWHSGYFSILVWMVLLFMNGPRKLEVTNYNIKKGV